ncbi:amino acid ABC transporter permease [Terrarubrum flagellatum]|uniref:amino acid ABC transporter permease n=1 Tax=Terrirubrum flagellatum TaxID=2895980 RepID=UPI0031451D71
MLGSFDWNYIFETLPKLLDGLQMTLRVSATSIFLSLLFGLFGAYVRNSRIRTLSAVVIGYVQFVRGTPFLVQIFFIFYGFPNIGIVLSTFWSGVAALTLWASSFHIESFRAGLSTVSPGVKDAAASLGLKRSHYSIFIVFPIALRAALPSTLNTIVATLKNSAYLQTIGLVELTFVAVERVAYEFRTLEMFSTICVIYLGCVLIVSALGYRVQHWLDRPYVRS